MQHEWLIPNDIRIIILIGGKMTKGAMKIAPFILTHIRLEALNHKVTS